MISVVSEDFSVIIIDSLNSDKLRIHAKSPNYRYVDVTPILAKIQISFSDITSFEGRSILHRCL